MLRGARWIAADEQSNRNSTSVRRTAKFTSRLNTSKGTSKVYLENGVASGALVRLTSRKETAPCETKAAPVESVTISLVNSFDKRDSDKIAHSDTQDEDDLSDVSMSAETESSDSSDDESDAPALAPHSEPAKHYSTAQSPAAALLENTSRKRKVPSDTSDSPADIPKGDREPGHTKRVKLELSPDAALRSIRTAEGRLPSDRSLLPAEIWHHIFTFASPRTLGRLLRVNKIFRAHLDPQSPESPYAITPLSRSVVTLRQPEVIWQASRRLFRPWMPNPLNEMTELGMWQLSCNFVCDFCDKRQNPVFPISPDQWHSGPGEAGVRPIWAFAIRACGPCLQLQTIKEIDLLLSSSVPSPLMAALPFIFLTAELHVVASTTLQQGQPPTNMQIGKFFYKSHVEDIKQEFFKVKALGTGTAEEWIKGLETRGKEKRLDVVRWERWESSGGLQRMRSKESTDANGTTGKIDLRLPAAVPMPDAHSSHAPPRLSKTPALSKDHLPSTNFAHPLPQVVQFQPLPQRFDSPTQPGFGPFPRPFPSQTRHERTKEEVDKLKAARRIEIERRCLLLDPPITANLLAHMASFQAALQIIKPFDDNAWEMLKPRLLSQRADAQQREDDRVALTQAVQAKLDERLYQDGQAREAKDFVDHQWEDAQSIVKARTGAYADEIIRDAWAFGKTVNKETSPRFAAEVLLYVRKRFYAEIAKEDAQSQATGQELPADSPSGAASRKLSLENMRWVFDMKIKPHTEQYRKELFLCNGCENFKWYAFEGVCQHYASKHTSDLSSGSIIVHWKAEWPEEPPFNPEPSLGTSTAVPAASSVAPYINGALTAPPVSTHGGYQTGAAPMPPNSTLQGFYNSIPGQFADPHHALDQYTTQGQAAYVPPATFQAYPGFPGPQYQAPQEAAYQPYPYSGFEPPYSGAPPVVYDAPQAAPGYQGTNFEPSTSIQTQNSVPPEMPSHIPPVVYRTEEYKAHLQDIALIAKSLWNSTSGVKEMPGSVRVYTILYHILQRSREKYEDDPPLKMLIDGLQNNKDMRPVRNVNGLACKTCTIERANKPINPHTVSSKGTGAADRKLFSFPQLLNHFQSTHIENPKTASPNLDWTTDMVELPDKKKMRNLPNATGMDEYKLQLIKDALPDAFQPDTPEPEVEQPQPYDKMSHEDSYELAPSKDNHERYYTMPARTSPSPPMETRHLPAHEVGQGGATSPRMVPDHNDQTVTRYMERRIASPMGYKRIKREIYQDDNVSDYSAAPRHYPQHEEVGRRSRNARTRVISPTLQDIPLRPEYNYEEANLLPRLIEKAGMVAKPPSPRYQAQYARRVDDSYYRAEESHPPAVYDYPRTAAVAQPRPRPGTRGTGSEDGEVRNQLTPGESVVTKEVSVDTKIAAEQFLDNMLPAGTGEEAGATPDKGHRPDEVEARMQWAPERVEGSVQRYMAEPSQRVQYSTRNEEYRRAALRNGSPPPPHMRQISETAGARQPQYLPYGYEDHIEAPRQYYATRRTSDMVDRRYVMDDVVYRDERPINPDAHPRSGARFVSYEGLRYDDEVPRSHSPVYITDRLPERREYRALTPTGRHYAPQDPIYERRRSPLPQQPIEQVAYERVPRPGYYRAHPDEQPRRHPGEPRVEYVRADTQGEYVVQRPPLRREQEAVYTYDDMPRYEEVPQRYQEAPRYDEPPPRHQRQPVYEEAPQRPVYERAGAGSGPGAGAAVSRNDPEYYEEYDPRHPAPPPEVSQRSLRYD
ncbi:hypothetical protein V490_03200 [Pseudogymnoascus sp. VKM F-3557]|nr:hypothetical protein V490_03200 [Pseudogymnoascus sp. VKM F-3557]